VDLHVDDAWVVNFRHLSGFKARGVRSDGGFDKTADGYRRPA
jgi:hypothetical protein